MHRGFYRGSVWARWRRAAGATVATWALAGVAAEPAGVIVTIEKPMLEYQEYREGDLPAAVMRSRDGVVGGAFQPSLLYSCSVEVGRPKFGSKTLPVKAVRVNARLGATIWMLGSGGPGQVSHLEAHWQIASHYYALIEPLACEVAAPLLGRKIALVGGAPDRDRMADLRDTVMAALKAGIGERILYAQERFETYTTNDPALPVAAALERALAAEARNHASNPGG